MSADPDFEKYLAGGSAPNITRYDLHDVNTNVTRYDLHHDTHEPDEALDRLKTAGSLTISPELFEKIYLSPKNQVSGNLRSTLGNPTPL